MGLASPENDEDRAIAELIGQAYDSGWDDAKTSLGDLCKRAARAISAGCVDTNDTLALVAELEAAAGEKQER